MTMKHLIALATLAIVVALGGSTHAQAPFIPGPPGPGTPAILAAGATSQLLFQAGDVTHGCSIVNPTTATEQNIGAAEVIWVSFNGAAAVAAAGANSIPIEAGTGIGCAGPNAPSINWIATTIGHRIVAYRW